MSTAKRTPTGINRVLITNDDGIDAHGLSVLEAVAHDIAREVWVVAPRQNCSGAALSVTVRGPIRMSARGHRRWVVDGTPTDCVAVALGHLMRDTLPDLVLSGINHGANLAYETAFSGTVSAATAATISGIPAIALSQSYRDPGAIRWDTARSLAPGLIRQLWRRGWPDAVTFNINFPDLDAADVSQARITRQGIGLITSIGIDAEISHSGETEMWLRLRRRAGEQAPDSDIAALRAGAISITPLGLDRTQAASNMEIGEQINLADTP